MHKGWIIVLFFILYNCKESSEQKLTEFYNNPVIAHRGAWKAKGLPQNSIAALQEAIELGCTGSEFDVRMTGDKVLIVTHDNDYYGLNIEESTYKELAEFKLPNGEALPKLSDFINIALKQNKGTSLVCEIKPASSKERSIEMAERVYNLVDSLNAHHTISYYISFGYPILQRLEELNPSNQTLYLDGSKAPDILKQDSITGLDYFLGTFKNKPQWIAQSRDLGLILNAWTVNNTSDIDWLIAENFDYITTDEPEKALSLYNERNTVDNYKLVWNDEFFGKRRPDSLKWNHEIGFKRNQELQYYVNDSSASFVKDGMLYMQVDMDTIKNMDHGSLNVEEWIKNRKYGYYTAPSLTTRSLASWKYGKVEIKAKLPKGRGLWPAFWMLGDNYDEVGWPDSGEIDIMEHVGYIPDSIFGTVHTKSYNHIIGTQLEQNVYVDDPYGSFHVYSIEWTPEKIEFLLDSKVYNHIKNEHKTAAEWPFDQPFFLKVNIAVGGMLGGREGIDDSIFPQQMVIDYIRVYQKGD